MGRESGVGARTAGVRAENYPEAGESAAGGFTLEACSHGPQDVYWIDVRRAARGQPAGDARREREHQES